MSQNYTDEFKKKIVRLHEEEGRTYKSITDEYGVSKASQSKWCREFSKECQTKAEANPEEPNEMDLMKENRCLRKELEEAQKERGLLQINICAANTITQHITATRNILTPFLAATIPAVSASTPATGTSVASMIAGKVMTDSVT